MQYILSVLVLFLKEGLCTLWPKGVVHFAINKKDYDLHSQDVILSAIADVESEICVKFFNTPLGYNASADARILYITNPDKRKNCRPDAYNFSASVVDMAIGYKCLDSKNIARIVVDMLRASIVQTMPVINSFDLIRRFQEMDDDPSRSFLLSPADRNFINAHYHTECGALQQRAAPAARRSAAAVSAVTMSPQNEQFYKDKLWPLGIVMYGVADELRESAYHSQLRYAMTNIELGSCVVFQEVRRDDLLKPKSLLWFGESGADAPELGFREGNQSVSLRSVASGARGHAAAALGALLRALGMPMASNRPDRDNHVTIHWNNVEKGKEHLLEKYPMEAWIRDARLPYDFASASHAPANYACRDCSRGDATVLPAQDQLWQRALSMGHRMDLSPGDKEILAIMYSAPCRERYTTNTNK